MAGEAVSSVRIPALASQCEDLVMTRWVVSRDSVQSEGLGLAASLHLPATAPSVIHSAFHFGGDISTSLQIGDQVQEGEAMQCMPSTLKRRKWKMNKHKYRKRRKAMRAKLQRG